MSSFVRQPVKKTEKSRTELILESENRFFGGHLCLKMCFNDGFHKQCSCKDLQSKKWEELVLGMWPSCADCIRGPITIQKQANFNICVQGFQAMKSYVKTQLFCFLHDRSIRIKKYLNLMTVCEVVSFCWPVKSDQTTPKQSRRSR